MNIRASSTISQRLAEAHQANMEALNPVLEYLKEFTSVFSKQSFDTLLVMRYTKPRVRLNRV